MAELRNQGLTVSGDKEQLWARLQAGHATLPHSPNLGGVAVAREARARDVHVIVIPGVSREGDEPARADFECRLLRTLSLEHKAFLLLCGGVWRLHGIHGVTVGASAGHSAAKMVSINPEGRVCNNTDWHDVRFADNEHSRRVWPHGMPPNCSVNSVHPEAIQDPGHMFTVIARSVEQEVNIRGRITTAVECIEAVITTHAHHFPLVAVQWHPEAYFALGNSAHRQLMRYVLRDPIWLEHDDDVNRVGEALQAVNIM